jgi:redox-sensitive bicupin YhaK (pirin superfamily)
LGTALPIHPGAVNLMIAGKGITHSERTRGALRAKGYKLHGLQLWMALPEPYEEMEPAFIHTPADDIPEVNIAGTVIRVIMGAAFGVNSPVRTFSPTLYFEANMENGSKFEMPEAEELGIYVVAGEAFVDGERAPINSMTVLNPKAKSITAKGPTRLAVIGGAHLGRRYLDWNFVSSRKERIANAKADWRAGRFKSIPGDDDEYIPLP